MGSDDVEFMTDDYKEQHKHSRQRAEAAITRDIQTYQGDKVPVRFAPVVETLWGVVYEDTGLCADGKVRGTYRRTVPVTYIEVRFEV